MATVGQSTLQKEPATLWRHHSTKLDSATQGWIAGIDWPNTNSLESVATHWSSIIRKIAAEGLFRGFAKVVRLCRAVHAAINDEAASVKIRGSDNPIVVAVPFEPLLVSFQVLLYSTVY